MSLAETFLAEFQQEVETTRKFLQNLPADKLDWQPHEKSLTAGQLALHVARVPGEVLEMGLRSHITMADLNPPSGYRPTSFQEIMDELDESEAKVKELLPTITDAQMQETWSLQVDGNPIFELPRAALLRSIMFNHWYHHRGQFGVYLRLLGAKVPSSYGPSGDEMPEFLQGVEMSMS
ncbi:MAG: DinB family protein [Pirellulales bacterium]|nr:DinB family protein [Pirellulales bacterium]